MAKRFTLAQAERLLPEVERLLKAALDQKAEYVESLKAIEGMRVRLASLGGAIPDREKFTSLGESRQHAEGRLRETLQQLESIGCLVKDLDIGLLDFPTIYHGQEVYLCWRLGEERIAFWHGVDEGFRGRKPIDAEFIAAHRADD